MKTILSKAQYMISTVGFIAAVSTGLAHAQDWPMQGNDYANQRYSTLTEINRENVADITEIGFYPSTTGGARQQTVPVVLDGVLYFTVPNTRVTALDMKTGQTLWTYEYEIDWHTTALCCGTLNRGVAVSGDLVFVATLNAQVIALDSKTGEERWKVQAADSAEGYSFTMAPTVVDDKVIVGSAGGEYGVRGFVDAYDVKTGERHWRFWTIPSPEQGGWYGEWVSETELGDDLNRDIAAEKAAKDDFPDAWKTGGGPVWTTPSYDAELGLLYVGVGNPSPNIDSGKRPGDNLYSNAIVALDINSGERRWHYQIVPHDRWDYDVTSPLILHDVEKDGKTIKAVSHAAKAGWLYTLDRSSGELVTRSENFVPQKNLFAQPTKEGINIAPGARGGANWAAPAYSPTTAMIYVLALHLPMDFRLVPAARESGVEWLGGEMFEGDEQGWGVVSAISPTTGKIVWEHKSNEWLWAGGALSTAGGLVFFPEPSGKLNALDEATGEVLWTYDLKLHLNAAPITFELNDKQFVLFASTKGLHFFGLPDPEAVKAAAAEAKEKEAEVSAP